MGNYDLGGDEIMTQFGTKCGYKLYINENDHNPPHFHLRGKGINFRILIQDAELAKEDIKIPINRRDLKVLLGWTIEKEEQLINNWNRAKTHQELIKIYE